MVAITQAYNRLKAAKNTYTVQEAGPHKNTKIKMIAVRQDDLIALLQAYHKMNHVK